ncbi:MAG: AAA family ATPase [Minicystis sp.]
MLSDVHLRNFGVFSDFRWSEHGRVNVVIGENDTGKSHLLKVLYAVAKSVEDLAARDAGAAAEQASRKLLATKLRWTFQPTPGLSALIKHGAKRFDIEVGLANRTYKYSLIKGAPKSLGIVEGFKGKPATDMNAVFLPPKEVLTIFAAIEISRSKYEIYGFDDTYYDLLKLLRVPATQGEVAPEFLAAAEEIGAFIGGEIVRKGIADEFLFVRGSRAHTMPQTADGIKKLGILANLIRNRSIKPGTILFLDEPETNLHPRAITAFTDMLFRLSRAGVQVYVATHSYFVIKQLEILAKRHTMSIPFCSLLRRGDHVEARFSNLSEGMPDNPIIDESIRLYEQGFEIDMARAGK